jgi:peptidoglycan/xylan/chitin deacetylase (PgdA/CDA1 family)
MSGIRDVAERCAFEALYFSGASTLAGPLLGGLGAIMTLHHVKPARSEPFQPNKFLEITPEFLEALIGHLRRSGYELVSIDEAQRRLTAGSGRRFVVMTLDDGYRDNTAWAYPIFKKHGVPFALYVVNSFADGSGLLWWLVLEAIIAANDVVVVQKEGGEQQLPCRSLGEKDAAFETLRHWLATLASESTMVGAVHALAARYGVDSAAVCHAQCLSWDDIAALAADPLVTIGAHTVNHVKLQRTSDATARSELAASRAGIESRLRRNVIHFAYPFGDAVSAGAREFALAAELGFATAVTTRPRVLHAADRQCMTALPRVSISGKFQHERYVDVLLSGAATSLWSGYRWLRPN